MLPIFMCSESILAFVVNVSRSLLLFNRSKKTPLNENSARWRVFFTTYFFRQSPSLGMKGFPWMRDYPTQKYRLRFEVLRMASENPFGLVFIKVECWIQEVPNLNLPSRPVWKKAFKLSPEKKVSLI